MSDWLAAAWDAPRQIVAGTSLRGADNAALPLPGKPCWLKQVHGASVVTAGHFDEPPEADASVKGLAPCGANNPFLCVVRTADCLPVLMCSKDGGVFAAAHAGWRGLAAGVIENTIVTLDIKPANLLVWLGPAISQAAFEVGDEVREAFLVHDPKASSCFERNARGRWQADLYGLARQRLNAAGVLAVSGGEFCTYSDEKRFYSYRRNPDCGRLVSFIGLLTP
jgi:YfiH family protein